MTRSRAGICLEPIDLELLILLRGKEEEETMCKRGIEEDETLDEHCEIGPRQGRFISQLGNFEWTRMFFDVANRYFLFFFFFLAN